MDEVASLHDTEDCVWCVAWNYTGTLLAASGADHCIRLYTSESGTWTLCHTLEGAHTHTVRSIAFSPCGNYLASGSFDSTLAVFEKKEGEFECIATLDGHENEVKSVAWSPSGQYLASCSRDKSVWVWETEDDGDFQCSSVINAHSQDVKIVRWHPEEDRLYSASYDNTVKVYAYDGDDWVERATLTGHESTVWSIALDPTGRDRLVSVGADGCVRMWEKSKSGILGYTPYGHAHGSLVMKLGFGPVNHDIVRGPADVQPTNCSTFTDSFRNIPESSYWKTTCLVREKCKQSSVIATGSGDNSIKLYRPPNHSWNSPELTLDLVHSERTAHLADVNCVAFNPKQPGLLASCCDEGVVKLWQLQQSLIYTD